MKILQIRTEFSDNGPGSQTLTIANELKRRGHEVIFTSSGGHLSKKIVDNGHLYLKINDLAINKRGLLSLCKVVFKLRKVLKEHEIDVVHAHNAVSVLLINMASLFLSKNINVFQSVRGVEVRKNYQWRNWIYKVIKVDRLFAVSNYTADILVSFGVPRDKIKVTYNGADLGRFNLTLKDEYRQEIRSELGVSDKDFLIGIVGRQDGNKGHRELVLLLNMLRNRYENLHIVLVGDGIEKDKNIQLIKEMGLSERAHFLGLRLDVERIHASLDVFVLFSRKGLEMFPNVLVEAMSYGVPFVATDTAGVKETAKNGSGIICDCGEINQFEKALIELLDSEELRREKGRLGIERVNHDLNIVSVIDKIEAAYTDSGVK